MLFNFILRKLSPQSDFCANPQQNYNNISKKRVSLHNKMTKKSFFHTYAYVQKPFLAT